MLDSAGNRPGPPRVHPKKDVNRSCAIAPGHKRRERWPAVGRLCKDRLPFDGIEGVGTVCENEPVTRLVQRSSPETHMLHSAGYGDPKLPHLSVDLQPRPPLSHSPCGDEPPLCHAHANRPALSPDAVRLDCKKSCQNSAGNASSSSTILRQKAVMPFPNYSRQMLVWVVDCRWENR